MTLCVEPEIFSVELSNQKPEKIPEISNLFANIVYLPSRYGAKNMTKSLFQSYGVKMKKVPVQLWRDFHHSQAWRKLGDKNGAELSRKVRQIAFLNSPAVPY